MKVPIPCSRTLRSVRVMLLAVLLTAAGCATTHTAATPAGTTHRERVSHGVHHKPSQSAHRKHHKRSSLTGILRASYATTRRSHSARVSVSDYYSARVGGKPVSRRISASGVIDWENHEASLAFDNPRMGVLQERVIGGSIYEKVPKKAIEDMRNPSTRRWQEIDLGHLAKEQFGTSAPSVKDPLMQGGQSPFSGLDYLRGVSTPVEKVGTQKVRGVRTTHYRMMAALLKVEANEPPRLKQSMSTARSSLRSPGKVPVEVWLDKKGRVRREKITFKVPQAPQPGAKSSGSAPPAPEVTDVKNTVVEDFYDFGTSVRVAPPPKDQIQNLTPIISRHKALAPAGMHPSSRTTR